MKKIKFKQYNPKTKTGWTEWIKPKMKGYLLKCCDCGLTHEFQFRTIVESKHGGKTWGTLISDPMFKIEFRVKRRKL